MSSLACSSSVDSVELLVSTELIDISLLELCESTGKKIDITYTCTEVSCGMASVVGNK